MKDMIQTFSSDDIREIFLTFFEGEDHRRISASSLLPKDDPTLLFVNSGMAPLKPYFTGAKKAPYSDLCNVQPCIRTIDIDDVGDRHHLTFFEMLGSWSIGGYFKERAVELAFKLLIERFGFPLDKVYVTVYKGNESLGLPPDHETAQAWERVGIPKDQIIYLGEDNFWGPAGETGPCGPCTEMFFDTGEEHGPTYEPGGYFDDKKRYIEVWNAGVFMQFDKKADGTFGKLPFYSVDTGSGLERMALVLQNKSSVYETDLLVDLFDAVKSQLGSHVSEEACRIITDHVRASCFILSEGVLPGNEGRSYIPRRLIRKCVTVVERSGVSKLDYKGLIDIVVKKFGAHYPLLVQNRASITEAIIKETEDFQRVIGKGLERLAQLCEKPAPFSVSGKDAFELFATYGLPIEITREVLQERGVRVDEQGYDAEFAHHQSISRGKSNRKGPQWLNDATVVEALLNGRTSKFVGYQTMECDANILALAKDGKGIGVAEQGDQVEVLTDATPFYAESGGQVGDSGEIRSASALLRVEDTQKLAGVHSHRARVIEGVVKPGDKAKLVVDQSPRRFTMANHSATHLLHAALRSILGEHVKQKGSHVDSERLRFDFTHPKKVTPEELRQIEQYVNLWIRNNYTAETTVTSYQKAVAAGALAFFGESYGEKVRMIRFGDASIELCGGTHVSATGDIGAFRIVSESGVASGVRRIVAVSGGVATDYSLRQDELLHSVAQMLKVRPEDLPNKIVTLLKNKEKPKPQANETISLEGHTKTLPDGFKFIAARVVADPSVLGDEACRLADSIDGAVVLASEINGNVRMAVAVSKSKRDQCQASKLLQSLAPMVNGKGGGNPRLARGGGDDANGISKMIEEVPNVLQQIKGIT